MNDATGNNAAPWQSLPAVDGVLLADYTVPIFPVPVRTFALRLNDDAYAVFSPARNLAGTFTAGPVSYVVAGNAYHHMGCTVWKDAHPGAKMLAAPVAVARLTKKGHADIDDVAKLNGLPAGVKVHVCPYIRSGDLILSVPAADGSRAWLLFDTFLNVTKARGFFQMMMLRLLNEYPGIKVPRVLLPLLPRKDRKAYREWFEALIELERPTLLVPAHGSIERDAELPARLVAALREVF